MNIRNYWICCNSIIIARSSLVLPGGKNSSEVSYGSNVIKTCTMFSVLFAFQKLFRNDVTYLTGLIALIDPSCFSAIGDMDFNMRNVDNILSIALQKWNYVHGKLKGFQTIYFMSRVSRVFLVYYLRLQSLIQLHFPKRDILSALNDLKHANVGLTSLKISCCYLLWRHWIDCSIEYCNEDGSRCPTKSLDLKHVIILY